jgi:hypothetical protein
MKNPEFTEDEWRRQEEQLERLTEMEEEDAAKEIDEPDWVRLASVYPVEKDGGAWPSEFCNCGEFADEHLRTIYCPKVREVSGIEVEEVVE